MKKNKERKEKKEKKERKERRGEDEVFEDVCELIFNNGRGGGIFFSSCVRGAGREENGE